MIRPLIPGDRVLDARKGRLRAGTITDGDGLPPRPEAVHVVWDDSGSGWVDPADLRPMAATVDDSADPSPLQAQAPVSALRYHGLRTHFCAAADTETVRVTLRERYPQAMLAGVAPWAAMPLNPGGPVLHADDSTSTVLPSGIPVAYNLAHVPVLLGCLPTDEGAVDSLREYGSIRRLKVGTIHGILLLPLTDLAPLRDHLTGRLDAARELLAPLTTAPTRERP